MLVVEDGSGLSTAQVYRSVADTSTYLTTLGFTAFSSADSASQEIALLRATDFAERCCGDRVDGVALTETQALTFPRQYWSDRYFRRGELMPTKYFDGICHFAELDVLEGIQWGDPEQGVLLRKTLDWTHGYQWGANRGPDVRYPEQWQRIAYVFNPFKLWP